MLKGFVVVCMTLSLVLLTGCEKSVVMEAGVQYATAKVLSEHPEWVETAGSILDAVYAQVEAEELTLPEMKAFILSRVPWDKLSSEDGVVIRLFVTSVLNIAEDYIAGKADGVMQGKVAVKEVLDNVRVVIQLRRM